MRNMRQDDTVRDSGSVLGDEIFLICRRHPCRLFKVPVAAMSAYFSACVCSASKKYRKDLGSLGMPVTLVA